MHPNPHSVQQIAVRDCAPIPQLTVNAVRDIYDALRRGKPVMEHPLFDFQWIHQHFGTIIPLPQEPIPQVGLYDALTSVLRMNLDRLRETHELPELIPDLSASAAVADLANMAQTSNRFLIGGTAIFYRYARYDLDWQVAEIARHLGQSRRSTQRDMNDFWYLLTESWIRLEMDIRKAHLGANGN